MIRIKNRFTYSLICEEALDSIKQLAQKNKANLGYADLRGADLGGADLRDADLGGANLGGADLGGADLRGANLGGANLGYADLGYADFRGADLGGAKIKDNIIINYKDTTGIGKERRQLRCFYLDDKSFYFMAGCFSGTEKELKEAVIKKYSKDCEYMEAIKFLKRLCKKY